MWSILNALSFCYIDVEIRTPSATTATESGISPATANPDAAPAPDPTKVAAEADVTLGLTHLVIAVEVEAATTATIADAHQIEDAGVLHVVTATTAAMTVDMTTAEKAAVAIATKSAVNAVPSGAGTADVAAAMTAEGDALPLVVAALAHQLGNAGEAHLLRMREEDPVLVIPVSNYCQHFDVRSSGIL